MIKELGGRKAKEEFALKECPAYIPSASGGGTGEIANTDGSIYENLS